MRRYIVLTFNTVCDKMNTHKLKAIRHKRADHQTDGRNIMKCDLHTHSIYSDGSMSPSELISLAKEKDLIIALTDHNTTSGLPEFMSAAEKNGVCAVPGTEISCDYEGREFHLLGLFISSEYYEKVESLMRSFRALKKKSNMELVERLKLAGYDIDYEDVQKKCPQGNINRANIASVMMEKGYVSSISEAFDTVLSEEYGFYVKPKRPQLADLVRFLYSVHALPVLAHPLKEVDGEYLKKMLPELVEAGLQGIETMHSSYTENDISMSKSIAKEFHLLESGGSDYHGSIKPGILLGSGKNGLNIPMQIYTDLKERHTLLFGVQ